MSDEKRKNARLQGRFSDEFKTSKKEKQKRLSDQRDDGSTKAKSSGTKSIQAVDGVELLYDKDASVSFAQLEEKKQPIEINNPGEHLLSHTENGVSRVIFAPNFIPKEEADELMGILENTTTWYDKNIIIHGQEVPQPRLVAWYGPYPYAYSGAILEPAEMPSTVKEIKEKVENYLQSFELSVKLNSVLLNLYRNEKDSVAWHSDDELTMGVKPAIASVSLGAVRKFQMKAKPHVQDSDKNLVSTEYFVNLTPGSLLIMDGCMQKDWKHQVPKEYHDRSARINLTFRTVFPIDKIPPEVPLQKSEVSTSSTPKRVEENKHIFDCKNFPPLGSNDINSENGHKESTNSVSVSEKENTVKSFETHDNKDYPNSASSGDDETASSLKVDVEEFLPCQITDAVSNLTNSSTCKLPNAVADSNHHDNTADNEFDELNADIEQYKEANSRLSDEKHDDAVESTKEITDNQEKSKYKLNAEASEFVPKSFPDFYKITMVKLAEMFEKGQVSPLMYNEFYDAILEKIELNPNFFCERDYYEIDTLVNINDGTLTEKNQKILIERLCSMIQNVAKIKHRKSVMSRYGSQSRTVYRDNYSRSRGIYRGSSQRDRGFKN